MKFVKEAIPYVLILVGVVLIRTFIATPVLVNGDSMNDTLKNNQILLLKKYDKTYSRFEIVVFKYNDSKLVKRVIGLPGESIEYKDGVLYINDQAIEDNFASETRDFNLSNIGFTVIPEGYYFVMGDNRANSSDSRSIGLISKNDIIGTSSFSMWPFKKVN